MNAQDGYQKRMEGAEVVVPGRLPEQDAEDWNCDGVPAELPSWDDLPAPPEEPVVRFPGLRAPADAPLFF